MPLPQSELLSASKPISTNKANHTTHSSSIRVLTPIQRLHGHPLGIPNRSNALPSRPYRFQDIRNDSTVEEWEINTYLFLSIQKQPVSAILHNNSTSFLDTKEAYLRQVESQ